MGLRTQSRSERFRTLFSKVDSNVAILMESAVAPHERWAEPVKRTHDTEHAGDDTTGSCFLDHVRSQNVLLR